MNKYKALSLILLMMAYKVSAESIVYITDEVDIPIRTNKSTKSEIIRLMPTGSELSILQSTEDGWTQIKMGDSFGWILTAFVSSSPPARDQLKKLTRTFLHYKVSYPDDFPLRTRRVGGMDLIS